MKKRLRIIVPIAAVTMAASISWNLFVKENGDTGQILLSGNIDVTQVDLPRGVSSGLSDAETLLKGIGDISFNYFTAKDVVRHPLVAAIIEAYEADPPAT